MKAWLFKMNNFLSSFILHPSSLFFWCSPVRVLLRRGTVVGQLRRSRRKQTLTKTRWTRRWSVPRGLRSMIARAQSSSWTPERVVCVRSSIRALLLSRRFRRAQPSSLLRRWPRCALASWMPRPKSSVRRITSARAFTSIVRTPEAKRRSIWRTRWAIPATTISRPSASA